MARKTVTPEPELPTVPEPIIEPINDDQPEPEPEMQLTVIENTSVFRWNFDEIKTRLMAGIEKYTGLTVTDENLPDMEKTSREIASLRTKVNRFRIDTKKQLTATADKFDAEVKELAAIIDQAEAPLKEQLQKYEDERVQAKEAELLAFAWKTCVSLGVSDQYYQTYQVPSKLTQRGTSDKQAKQEVVAAIEQLLATQRSDNAILAEQARLKEEADKQRQARRTLLEVLCESRSRDAGLQTPVTVNDVERQYPLLDSIDTMDLPGIVSREINRRAEIEQAAAVKTAPPPPMPAPPVTPVTPPYPPGLNTAPTTPRPPAPPPQGPPTTTPVKLWDVTLKFRCTAAQANQLKPILSAQGIAYEVIKQEEAPL